MGELPLKAFRAACSANDGSRCPLACGVGGGGGAFGMVGGTGAEFRLRTGGRGASPDGMVGAALDGCDGGTGGAEEAGLDGFLLFGGRGGFFPIGGGGLGLLAIMSEGEVVLGNEVGLRLLLKADTFGKAGAPPGGRGGAPGGRGAAAVGIEGAVLEGRAGGCGGCDTLLMGVLGAESSAPVFTPPPVFLSFGMPPANRPPS